MYAPYLYKLSFFYFYQIFSLVNKYYHKSYCRRYSPRPLSDCYIIALMYGQEGTSAVASCYLSVCGLYVCGLTDRRTQSDRRCMPWRSKIEARPPGIPVLKLKNSPPPGQRKIIKLNYHSLCNTNTLYTACISYAVFMGRSVIKSAKK